MIFFSYRADFEKKEVFIDLSFPQLQVEGDYDVNLMMLNIPIKSTGPVFMNFSKYKINCNISFQNWVYLFYLGKYYLTFSVSALSS